MDESLLLVSHQCVSHQFIFQLHLTTISLNVKPYEFSSLILHESISSAAAKLDATS